MHDVRSLGIEEVVRRTVESVADGPVFCSADETALVADGIVREILTGLALRRRPDAPG
jgi:hypothetical protein